MPSPVAHDVTQLLALARDGDQRALDRVLPLVYEEVRRLARSQRYRNGASETLNTTALVHEAYEKLALHDGDYVDRQHFFRVAARAIRQVLIDAARARKAEKRGGGTPDVSLDGVAVASPARDDEALALDEALDRLAALDDRQAQIVELRYFVGLTVPETADVLDLSPATVKRDWAAARAWLYREMQRTRDEGEMA
ncbi:sigma-70 family RNA polymerase sigma factor [Rubrivirga marina]|nr:sigma-70 family RNA polymerase sigma factor [Rubrivirga marina]